MREVLNLMVAADPRYQWEEMEGVIVIRPADSSRFSASTLQLPVPTISLRNIDASDVVTTIARMLGHSTTGFVPDSRVFSVEVPGRSTFLEALNALARAHGSLAWTIQRTDGRDQTYVAIISVFSGAGGSGFHVKRDSALTSAPIVIDRRERDASSVSVVAWDQVIPLRTNGLPISAQSINSFLVAELAGAARTPMGIESLPVPIDDPDAPSPDIPEPSVTLSGLTLHNAVARLMSLDRRYQWRDERGTLVFRPVEAWADPRHPLARRIEAFRVSDATLPDVMKALSSRMGLTSEVSVLPDARRFSIDCPAGSILDALNAIARAHGELSWAWEVLDAEDRKWTPGMAHRLTLMLANGTGMGFPLP